MEIIFSTKRTKISDKFKENITSKLERFERKVPDLQYIKIDISHQNNPSRAAHSEKVEITVARNSGEFIRTEAYEATKMSAFDLAFEKLSKRIRRDNDRRKSLKKNVLKSQFILPDEVYENAVVNEFSVFEDDKKELADDEFYLGDSSIVIKKKVHKGGVMSLDDAIYNMEMIDHDFYIYVDEESKKPSVVYRRHGYTYGVLELDS